MKIPLSIPNIDRSEIAAVQKVLESGWLTEGAPNLEFEAMFASHAGVKRAVTLNSCTSALHLALQAQAIKGEVILPSFTFAASANAVLAAGAIPVFADIEYGSCNIDPDDIERKITPATEAIMVVHYAGQCCRMDRIMAIAARHGLKVIEDSAETIGATFNGKMAGSFGVGCFSFFPTKNITTGEGGMLTTDDDALADTVKALAGHGIRKGTFSRENDLTPWLREVSMPGYNFRMSAILAAIGVEQMKKISGLNLKRRENAAYLAAKLNYAGIDLPQTDPACSHVYQMFTVKVKSVDRDSFVRGLRSRGVMASVHFTPPVHRQDYYARVYPDLGKDLPVTELVADTIATLPMYPDLTKPELDYIAESVGVVLHELEERIVSSDRIPYVVVFIPAYNEEGSIESVITKIQEHYVARTESRGYRTEIIVVDDGSRDKTVAISRAAGIEIVVSHIKNRGLGASTRTAMQRAFEMGADIAVKIDADFQHDPEDIDKVVRPIIDDVADSVFGTRFLGGLQYAMPVTRAVGNRFFSWLVSKLTGLNVTDGQTGLMAFGRRYLEQFNIIADYNETQQLILDSYRKNMRIIEVPVLFHKRTTGKSFISWRYPFKVLPTILRHYVRIAPFTVFMPTGLLFILAAAIVAIARLHSGACFFADATFSIWFVGGVLLLFMGLLADMVRNCR